MSRSSAACTASRRRRPLGINHPVDRDPVCGYVGIIGDVCPRCGRREGETHSAGKTGGAAGRIPVYRKKVKETQNEQADGKTDGNRQGRGL